MTDHLAARGRGHREDVLEELGGGDRTFRIARNLGWTTARARYYLVQLERAGRVERDPRYTAGNDIYWRPCPPPEPR